MRQLIKQLLDGADLSLINKQAFIYYQNDKQEEVDYEVALTLAKSGIMQCISGEWNSGLQNWRLKE